MASSHQCQVTQRVKTSNAIHLQPFDIIFISDVFAVDDNLFSCDSLPKAAMRKSSPEECRIKKMISVSILTIARTIQFVIEISISYKRSEAFRSQRP